MLVDIIIYVYALIKSILNLEKLEKLLFELRSRKITKKLEIADNKWFISIPFILLLYLDTALKFSFYIHQYKALSFNFIYPIPI